MKRKSLVLTFTAAILVALLMLVNRKGTFGASNTSFAVPEGKEITMIEMKQAGEKLTLALRDDVWTVNGEVEARKSAVSFLIQTLNSLAIKSPVSDELFGKEITDKGIEPVTVRIWSGRRQLNKFLVYKTESNSYGNIMMKGAGNKPFIVSIPGYEGAIGSNFNMNELFWKPFTIFNKTPDEIARVDLDYPATPDQSFLVYNFTTFRADEAKTVEFEEYDSARVMRYLSYFTWVPFETWAFDLSNEEVDSITTNKPIATLIMALTNGGMEKLTLWERSIVQDGKLTVDTDRAWGRKDDTGNIFLVRYFDIDPLLRRKSYFFGGE